MPSPSSQIETPQPPKHAGAGVPELAADQTTDRRPHRSSELGLVLAFLCIIAAVPITQTFLQLAHHERVQFTDVFRYRPTAKNLRQYEGVLKEKSWFEQTLRPEIQRLLFAGLHDTGAKAILGRNGWLFYRPDVRYLVEPNRPERDESDSRWVHQTESLTRRESVVGAIRRFHDQLKERGILLVAVPVPGKPSIYPDQVTGRSTAAQLESPTLGVLRELEENGVTTVNLFKILSEARRSNSEPLYLARDTHWTPTGAALAAQAVGARLRELGVAPAPTKQFKTLPVAVTRWGDVLEMMQIPGLRQVFTPEQVTCEQVVDPALGPLVPPASERPGTYRYPGGKTSVLVLGDSFCRIYQYPEPQSLGDVSAAGGVEAARHEQGTKRLLPGSAGFVSQLALDLKAPVDAIYSDGGASTDVRRKLSTNPEILEGKKVVVWEFVERDIALGAAGWEDVPLPPTLN